MKYQPPFGESDPNAGYTNGNPATGTEGSIPRAEGQEHPQREIIAVITAAGLVPSATNLTQLRDAILQLIASQTSSTPDRALLHYGVATGTADAITVDVTPNLAAYVAGATVIFIASAENTGAAATLNVEGLGPAALRRWDGASPIKAGDLAAGWLAIAIHDGSNFRLVYSAAASSDLALWHYGAAFGTANALQVDLRPGFALAAAGLSMRVKCAATNTGSATLDFGAGAKPIVLNSSGAALLGGELVAGHEALFFYDGTSARLVNPASSRTVLAAEKAAFNFKQFTTNVVTSAQAAGAGNLVTVWDSLTYEKKSDTSILVCWPSFMTQPPSGATYTASVFRLTVGSSNVERPAAISSYLNPQITSGVFLLTGASKGTKTVSLGLRRDDANQWYTAFNPNIEGLPNPNIATLVIAEVEPS